MSVEKKIEHTLSDNFVLSHLEVINESHMHSGTSPETHFKVILVSDEFDGIQLVQRHRKINELVETPLDNPNEQADKVKNFRKTWNLLGHADEELDKGLNEAFNQACELAFAPCRLFFAEQEKLREQHFILRTNIIEQATAMKKVARRRTRSTFLLSGVLLHGGSVFSTTSSSCTAGRIASSTLPYLLRFLLENVRTLPVLMGGGAFMQGRRLAGSLQSARPRAGRTDARAPDAECTCTHKSESSYVYTVTVTA